MYVSNDNAEILYNYIRKIAKKESDISNIGTAEIYTGTIVSAISGMYTIKLSDSDNTINAIPLNDGTSYNKDDYVYLLRSTDTNNTTIINYFIFGIVSTVKETFYNLTDMERFLEDPYAIIQGPKGQVESWAIERSVCGPQFDAIQNTGYFCIKTKVIPPDNNNNNNNITFGLKITITYNTNQIEEFVFNSYDFIGQPYLSNFENIVQKKLFHLTKAEIINKIEISTKISETDPNCILQGLEIIGGSLLEIDAIYKNEVRIENDKDYFDKGYNNSGFNEIKLISNISYNGQSLITDALQYYWLINLKENKGLYNIPGLDKDWYCLNSYQNVSTATGEKIKIWDNKNNFIVLNQEAGKAYFSQYTNKVKCVAKYFDTIIESKEFNIYNYNYEDFNIKLEANSQYIVKETDEVTITCNIVDQNNKTKNDISNFDIKYYWYKEGKEEAIGVFSNINKLVIRDSGKTLTKEEQESGIYEMTAAQEKFYCKVEVYKNGTPLWTEDKAGPIAIQSLVSDSTVKEIVQYKYYIADNYEVSFKEGTDGGWKIEDGDSNGTWLDGDYKKVFNIDILTGTDADSSKEYFIYYTQKRDVYQGESPISEGKWAFPQIARSLVYDNNNDSWKNFRTGNNINQLNTFNQLTNNGTEDALEFAKIPVLSTDKTPNPNKTYFIQQVKESDIEYIEYMPIYTWGFRPKVTYYIKNTDPNSGDSYIPVSEGSTFDIETKYYSQKVEKDEEGNDKVEYIELTVNKTNFDLISAKWPIDKPTHIYEDMKDRLFINATYIRSGTLEVPDKFYASLDQDDVRIGGFNVGEQELTSKDGKVGISSNDTNSENIAFWAGDKFKVYHDGSAELEGTVRIKKDSTIAGFNVGEQELTSKDGKVGISSEDLAFWAGAESNNKEDSPLKFYKDGSAKLGNLYVSDSGWLTGTNGEDKTKFDLNGNGLTLWDGANIQFGTSGLSIIQQYDGIFPTWVYMQAPKELLISSGDIMDPNDEDHKYISFLLHNGMMTVNGSLQAENGYFANDLQLKNATVLTSDKNAKKDIENLPSAYEILFNKLKPVRFKFKENESNRYHTGFIAQEVEEAIKEAGLTTQELAAFIKYDKDDGTEGYGLRYGEFIALNTHMIQKLQKRIDELEAEIKILKENKN